ncbi:heme o synthase [Sediminitomix flava]|uniref:Protoheme IX farnesyltransferase n=1 Tax=Sediminitomix flava TaxID=379075 RepID=A0A315ZAG5_SEDFL|nr:heme o synthase [Sediminitomix flava]PWJ42531.1 protoheme IX farnesyltransferase [Sediminitomix flava]
MVTLNEEHIIEEQIVKDTSSSSGVWKAYWQILKFRLTTTVVFSGAFGYLFAYQSGDFSLTAFLGLIIGSFLVVSSANIFNQVYEKDTDALMKRTKDRPIPSGKMSANQARIYAVLLLVVGSAVLWFLTNPLTMQLSVLSHILYSFVYTPMKRVSPFCVLIGAFPGALPPMIGWVAYSNEITAAAWILFGFQFIWQFPHFWAIAWMGDDDYKRVGIQMLPYDGKKGFNVAFYITIYTMVLIPLAIMPYTIGISGPISALVAAVGVFGILYFDIKLMLKQGFKDARNIMLASVFYLPLVQIIYVLDKV